MTTQVATKRAVGYFRVSTTHQVSNRGIFNRSGQPWGAWAIRGVLTNEATAGALVYGKKGKAKGDLVRVPDFFPTIFSPEEWVRLQERQAIRRAMPKGKGHVSEYLLSGVARCGECGGALVGHSGALKKDGTRYAHYRCTVANRSSARCSNYHWHPARKLEQAILAYLGQYSDPVRVRELLFAQKQEQASVLGQELANTEKRLAALERDFLANLDLLKRGILNEAEFTRANEARRAEREALRARSGELRTRIEAERQTEAQVQAIPGKVASFLEAFRSMEPRQAKAQLQLLLKAAHVHRDGRVELEFRQ